MKILVFGAGVPGCNLARNFFCAREGREAAGTGQLGRGDSEKRPADQRQILAPDVLLFVYAALSGIMALFLR